MHVYVRGKIRMLSFMPCWMAEGAWGNEFRWQAQKHDWAQASWGDRCYCLC